MDNEGVEVTVQVGGRTHRGRYTADRHGIITVMHPEYGQKISQRGGVNTLAVARSMLKQLIREGVRAGTHAPGDS